MRHERKIVDKFDGISVVKDFYHTEDPAEIKKAIDAHARLRSVLIHHSIGNHHHKSIHRTPVYRKGAWFIRYRRGWERVVGYVTMTHSDKPDKVVLFWLII